MLRSIPLFRIVFQTTTCVSACKWLDHVQPFAYTHTTPKRVSHYHCISQELRPRTISFHHPPSPHCLSPKVATPTSSSIFISITNISTNHFTTTNIHLPCLPCLSSMPPTSPVGGRRAAGWSAGSSAAPPGAAHARRRRGPAWSPRTWRGKMTDWMDMSNAII